MVRIYDEIELVNSNIRFSTIPASAISAVPTSGPAGFQTLSSETLEQRISAVAASAVAALPPPAASAPTVSAPKGLPANVKIAAGDFIIPPGVLTASSQFLVTTDLGILDDPSEALICFFDSSATANDMLNINYSKMVAVTPGSGLLGAFNLKGGFSYGSAKNSFVYVTRDHSQATRFHSGALEFEPTPTLSYQNIPGDMYTYANNSLGTLFGWFNYFGAPVGPFQLPGQISIKSFWLTDNPTDGHSLLNTTFNVEVATTVNLVTLKVAVIE